jgi:transposase-like protein
VSWKERKAMAADLKPIYRAATAEFARTAFREKYPKHQTVADVWQRNCQGVIPFLDSLKRSEKSFTRGMQSNRCA